MLTRNGRGRQNKCSRSSGSKRPWSGSAAACRIAVALGAFTVCVPSVEYPWRSLFDTVATPEGRPHRVTGARRPGQRAAGLDPTAGLARSTRPQLGTQTTTPARAGCGRPNHHHRPPPHPAPEPTMALVRSTDHRSAKPRRTQLNPTPQPQPPRTRRTGDTTPGTTHAPPR